ncbi:meiosis protein SPO22/ZIP4 like-domain-containing protein [Xylariaceae sp. FL0662B]|nr:meiosis protein SPO22/ZIP4 like-domain-containing protein [Xylariaceae sp. FL0662B]
MESNGSHAKDKRPDGDAKSMDNTPTTTATSTPTDANKSPRKRRKVNHACVYCRRSERPCTRCIKRNIGHLCHDEPRDPDSKKPKGSHGAAGHDESEIQPELSRNSIDQSAAAMAPPSFNDTGTGQSTKQGYGAAALGQANSLHLVSPNPVSSMQANASGSNMNQFGGLSDTWLTAQNQFHDMHHYHPQYMLAPEVTHEFNLLSDFLNTSLLDDGGTLPDDPTSLLYRQQRAQPTQSDMAGYLGGNNHNLPAGAMQAGSMLPPSAELAGVMPVDKTREFYLQAADPSGNDTPEARMQRVMKAKYDAGLLRPFNYVKGYAQLSTYMDGHITPASKQKILRQLDRFRPKFREKVQGLTDMELVYVEMWFEKTLMEYDRVFAAMAVPACCWRRTGEIFRGNKEMAELIHVPVERLRDGKISLHEILTEESLVRYWEEFGTIAFDPAHDTLLTACALKNPDDRSNDPIVNCCFSFMIRRDDHNIRDDGSELQNLTSELENQINAIKAYFLRSTGYYRHKQLDSTGTDLWNWCTRIKRQDDAGVSPTKRRFLTLVRVYSFLILALAQWGDHNTPGDLIRLEKLAIKAGRSCIGDGELDFAPLVMQKAAEYNGLLQSLQERLPKEEAEVRQRLEAEYLTLRIALAWKEDRLDVADHLYEKVQSSQQSVDVVSAENLADSLFEIGKGLTEKKNYALAVKWLERSYEIVNNQSIELLSREAIELRLAISQALVRAYLGIGTTEGFEKAENHVGYIESGLGDKLLVLLLRLEILQSSPAEVFDSNAYANILGRMIRSVDISESNFNLMIHHIRKLNDKSPSLASSVLDEYITTRVLPTQREEWIERVVVLHTIQGLRVMFDKVESTLPKPLPAAPVLAVQTLIWKRVDASFNQRQLDIAEEWCHLAMHPALQHSSPANTAKFARKLLQCALEKNSLGNATDIFRAMSESAKRDPKTLYLAYRLALRSGDRDMASECLRHITETTSSDSRYLYACCIDAQKAEDKTCAIEALRHLFKQYEFIAPGPVRLPALLRVIIRLEVSLLNEQGQTDVDRHTLIEDLCQVFEGVVTTMQRDPRNDAGNKLFTVEELDWFCKNAYNLALKNTQTWSLAQIVRLFQCCLAIIAQYPRDLPVDSSKDLSLRGMFCNFIMATARIALARSEDNVETQLQHYLLMRGNIKSFDAELESQLKTLDEISKYDLQDKLSILLVFDFEGASCRKISTYQAMADCTLRSQSLPGQVLYTTLRKIINEVYSLDHFNLEKLAKYMRCLLKATLSSEPEYPLKIIEETSKLDQEPFPPLELEWFITTAFNHGVELFGANEDELSKRWIAHAFTLAHYHQDGGDLERELQKRHTNLKWDS